MAKIYERLLTTDILREKRRVSFDTQNENLLGENSICMVNLLEIPRVIVFSLLLNDCLASVFSDEKFCFLKRARKSKCRHYRYTVRSIHFKLYIRTSYPLFTVSSTYLKEIRRQA